MRDACEELLAVRRIGGLVVRAVELLLRVVEKNLGHRMLAIMALIATDSGAEFSRCRRWRYLLWRRWDEAKPAANFLMLNPSTADEVKLDPSCTRARVYAERWGFGALIVTNIFGWRATDPEEMKSVRDPVG